MLNISKANSIEQLQKNKPVIEFCSELVFILFIKNIFVIEHSRVRHNGSANTRLKLR